MAKVKEVLGCTAPPINTSLSVGGAHGQEAKVIELTAVNLAALSKLTPSITLP